jgi:branched-chain amino acid transport system substrate-binding protein
MRICSNAKSLYEEVLMKTIVKFLICFCFLLVPCELLAQEMKIGFSSCLTGPAAFYGSYMKKGVDLAIDEINAKGGIKGSKIVPLWEDDKLNPTVGVSIIKKFISVDKVPVVVGSMTATALAMVPVADKENTVFITSLSTHPDIAKMSKWSFRNCINTVPSAMAVVDFAYKQQGKRKLGLLYFQNESTRRIAEGVKKRFEDLGGTVVAMEMLPEEGVDYRSPIIKIKNANPDSVYVCALARQAGLAMKQLVESGVQLQFYTDPNESPIWLETAGSAANGAFYGYLDIQKSYLDKYKAKYKEEGEIWGALYYDTMHTLAIAIEKGGYTAEGIRKALIEIKNYPGVTGLITYGPERDVVKPPIIKMVKDGKFVKYQ